MINRLIVITILFQFVSFESCFSQNNWQPAYIIKYPNDTIYGFVDNRESKINAHHCFFRKELKEETQEFNPGEIFGYRFINGKFYISKSVEGLNSEMPVFLEFIIQGRASVYHYEGEIGKFFIEKDDELIELKNTKTLVNKEERKYLWENKEYVGTLKYLLQDGEMAGIINNSELTSNSLKNIAKEYHERICPDEVCVVYERIKIPVTVRAGFYSGLSFNKINFGHITTSEYAATGLLGLRLEFENIFEWSENYFLVSGISFQRFTNYKLFEANEYTSSLITYERKSYLLASGGYGVKDVDVNIKASALKIPLTINYYFSRGQIKPYVGSGFSIMYILSNNKDFTYHRFSNLAGKSIPSFLPGIVGQFGSKFTLKGKHEVYTEFNYELSRTLETEQFLRFTNHGFAFNIGYVF